MKIQVLDFETTIKSEVHGSSAKDPINDFCTIIWGDHPDRINCVHNPKGFKRILGVAGDVLDSDLLVGHNLPFDLGYIIKYYQVEKDVGAGLVREPRIPETWDTQIAEYLMSGQRFAMSSLAELQEKYLGQKIKKDRISQLYKKGIGADRIIDAKYRCKRLWALYEQYCIDDGSTTLKIFQKQYERAKKLKMVPIIRLYNRYMVALVMMMSEGIHVDIDGVEKTIRDFKLKEIELLQEASKITDKYWNNEHLPPFNIGSPTHKSAILFGGSIKCKVVRDNGVYKDGRPKTKIFEERVTVKGMCLPTSLTNPSKVEGRYETGIDVVHNILEFTKSEPIHAEIHRYCELQVEAMKYKKMVSTYLKAFLDKSINGKIYPHFNHTLVITSRLSSSAPNFQNMPSSGEMDYHIQGKLVAPPGFYAVASDYSQLEMYVAAWNSLDEQLTKDLLEGLDFHCQSLAFAEQVGYGYIFNKCKVEKDKEYESKRSKAKAITFQKEYGAGVKKVAEGTGLEVDLVQKVFDALDEKYWKLKLFKEHVHTTAVHNQRPSLASNIPKAQKNFNKEGRRFNSRGEELLPIEQGNTKYFDNNYIRNVGYYQMPHGKLYSFQEYATIGYHGEVRRGLSIPQIKNYTSQGGAADVMAAATIELTEYALKHQEEVKVVNTIHDSVWFYIKKECLDLHLAAIEDIMCDVPKSLKKHLNVKLDFTFKVESKLGENFSEMKVWEKT